MIVNCRFPPYYHHDVEISDETLYSSNNDLTKIVSLSSLYPVCEYVIILCEGCIDRVVIHQHGNVNIDRLRYDIELGWQRNETEYSAYALLNMRQIIDEISRSLDHKVT